MSDYQTLANQHYTSLQHYTALQEQIEEYESGTCVCSEKLRRLKDRAWNLLQDLKILRAQTETAKLAEERLAALQSMGKEKEGEDLSDVAQPTA